MPWYKQGIFFVQILLYVCLMKVLLILTCGMLLSSATAMALDDHRDKIKVVDNLKGEPLEFASSEPFVLTSTGYDFNQVFIAPETMAVESINTAFADVKTPKLVRLFDRVTHPRYCKNVEYIRDKC